MVETQANNVNDALKDLVLNFPKLEQHLYDGNGDLRKFINIYVNDADIRDQDGVNTNLSDSDEVSLVPAIAGALHEHIESRRNQPLLLPAFNFA